MSTLYRGYEIRYNPKPIPTTRFDYDYWPDDWDLGDPRGGAAPSIEAARAEIDEEIEEYGEVQA